MPFCFPVWDKQMGMEDP